MRLPGLCLAVIGLAGLADAARAAQLDKLICADLKIEQGLLQQKGVATDMAKGPEWAKANLSRDRMKDIERLIHVDEQLAFRCPQPKPQRAPGDDEEGTTAAGPAKKGPGKAAEAKGSAVKPPAAAAKTAKAAPPTTPAEQAEPTATKPQPPRKATPKPKAKVDDAYSPAAAGQSAPSVPTSN